MTRKLFSQHRTSGKARKQMGHNSVVKYKNTPLKIHEKALFISQYFQTNSTNVFQV